MIQDPLQVTVITPNSHILTPTKTPFMCLRTCMKPDTCSYWEFMKKNAFKKVVKSALLKHLHANHYYI